ncbi:MAG: polyribonucleotide nucleotidyltransferase [Candidatus Taylorbacteria bacterium RIFOXYD2_FULL_36_9]|uniref:Polyribonucleotide nucleotidyltransferase n=1 Tax=Candidatus Taylorbacteria bacterium RIFOXYD2_FULL_36_9 TaxID=1802338 RepID=A0A1G2PHI0_9BACT|nr:MAG: polyribonucleotide nucleotidyltransferase [Candidatus Taylorbacteria bacterium RIFOXYD2_FULL_36_9]
MKKKEFSMELNGKKLSAEFSDLVENAHGSVLLKYGNTVILATAVISKEEKDADYLPLTVDYEEKFYASGQILGGNFNKREGKPSDEAILSGRVVDRTIRPLFDQWIRNEIQVVITILSIDQDDPDVLGVVAASLALGVSKIPFAGPVSAVRIGKHKTDGMEINPTYTERENENFEIDLIACGKDENINMIELGGDEAGESVIVDALKKASEEIEKINLWQKAVIAEIGVPKLKLTAPVMPEEIKNLFTTKIEPKLENFVMSGIPGGSKIGEIMDLWMKLANEKYPDIKSSFAEHLFEEKVDTMIHEQVLKNNKRADGRGIDEIRPLFAQAGGISPILHGSGIFYRGGTHILTALTLGGPSDAQIINGMEESNLTKRFMHHYNFPPYSTGETGKMGNTNRRMIGHGALAEKALLPVIPKNSIFPYTVRLVSEAMSSNGSTSMGSVCASTIALMDGGVPIKAPVAGIASGLMMDKKGNYKVLTDIQGPEDHYGDMDFKVAGTKNGVTAIQMDVKVAGVPIPALTEAFEKAKTARLKILEVILKEIAEPRKDISSNAPKILVIKINLDQIGGVIGSGGKTIKEIKEKTGADIDIEDDGTVYCTGKDGSAEKAKAIIEEMTHEYKAGEKFEGTVTKTTDFGAFVKIGQGDTEGLVHISEIAPFRVEKVESLLKAGDKVPVMVKGVDERDRISLSIKQADPDWAKRKTNTTSPRPPLN